MIYELPNSPAKIERKKVFLKYMFKIIKFYKSFFLSFSVHCVSNICMGIIYFPYLQKGMTVTHWYPPQSNSLCNPTVISSIPLHIIQQNKLKSFF